MRLKPLHLFTSFTAAVVIHGAGMAYLLGGGDSDTRPDYYVVQIADFGETALENPGQETTRQLQQRSGQLSDGPGEQRKTEEHFDESDVSGDITEDRAPTEAADQAAITYEEMIIARLERNKSYPLPARRMRIQGQAMIYIHVNRVGELVSYEVRQPTGHDILDQSIDRMVRSASPFPAMPENHPRSEVKLEIPISFTLR